MAKKESRPQLVWMERPPDNVLDPQTPEDERARWQYALDMANALRASGGVPPLAYRTPEEEAEDKRAEKEIRAQAWAEWRARPDRYELPPF
jgi:hypothetical protein